MNVRRYEEWRSGKLPKGPWISIDAAVDLVGIMRETLDRATKVAIFRNENRPEVGWFHASIFLVSVDDCFSLAEKLWKIRRTKAAYRALEKKGGSVQPVALSDDEEPDDHRESLDGIMF